jgi:hypothetical protein
VLLQWLTFASATIAAGLQGRKQFQGWLYGHADRREARRAELGGWSRGGVDTWSVRLAEPDPAQPLTTVTIAVCDHDGRPSADQAVTLRRYLEDHEYLSRNPGPAELETLERAAKDGSGPALRGARRRRIGRIAGHVLDRAGQRSGRA